MNRPTRYLSADDLVKVGSAFMEMLIRDPGALASAAARPLTTVFGEDAYPDLAAKAGALLHAVTRSHPLVDGNKRLGWAGCLVFLRVNGFTVEMTDDDAVDLVVDVAAGRIAIDELTTRLRAAMKEI